MLPFFLFVLSLGASVSCFADCGANGQRACCIGENSNGGPCNGGLAYSTSHGCIDPHGCACGNLPGFNSLGMCYQPTACGGNGQRACCNLDGEFAQGNSLACESGLVQIFNTCNDANPACICGGGSVKANAAPAEYALGICVQPAPCGDKGQRACCNGLTEFSNNSTACNSGLIEVPGCSGDCTCGGSTSVGETDGNSCTTIEAISEPATNATPTTNEAGASGTWTLPQGSLPTGPECPATGLCGYADLHVHMFANLAHGGATLAGEAWDANGVNAALAEDYGSSLTLVDKKGNLKPVVDGSAGLPECPSFLLSDSSGHNLCFHQFLFHGDHTALDTVTGGGTNDGANSNLGVPLFNGWPLWTSTVHQQVYFKWLERAWLGGLRLIVMDGVTNEALCKSGTKVVGTDCSLSMTVIDAELKAAQDFQTWLDTQYGGAGKGWFQIVKSPKQAASVIQQGKLAVVLGIEVDNLFNCHVQGTNGPLNGEGPACTPSYVQQQLKTYYGMGVRHIFPIHNFDNAYGTPSAWQDAINVGNIVGEGNWWDAVNCTADSGYGFSLDPATDAFLYAAGFGGIGVPPYPTFTSGSCHNTPGLTSLGVDLVQQAMSLGMIIDVDHMSINAFNETINLANQQSPIYAGIAATHVQFFDLYLQNYPGTGRYGRHERMRTYSQLQSIKNAGGMIAAMLKDDTQDTSNGWCLPQGNCAFGASSNPAIAYTYNYNSANAPPNNNGALKQNCSYSTTEWAQAYLYGVQAMGGAPVAMGSDFNGIAGHVGPRFGNGACAGFPAERAAQEFANNRLQYPFTIPGFGTFDKQVSGQKTYDFNVDGLAHIGLLPDMVADLKSIGLTDEQLQPLFGSAQAYIKMWSAVYIAPSPNVSLSGVPATAAFESTFTVTTNNNGTTTSVPTITAGPSDVCSINGSVGTMDSGTGTCSVTATWVADATYAKTYITNTATATMVPLAVTANNAAITFGQAIPTFTASYSGFVNNENQSVLSGSPSLTTTATPFSPPGAYTITAALGTLASANYSFASFKNGTLTINATGSVPPSGSGCNGAYQRGTFNGNITVAANQICEIDGGVVNGSMTSNGGIVILLGGATVTGNVLISGTATGSGGALPHQVCGATVKGNLEIQNDSSGITVGGTNCGATRVAGNLKVQNDSGAVTITSTSVNGNLTVMDNTSTILLNGNTVSQNLQVQNNTDAAANSTQVLNNNVSGNLVCSGNASITGQGNTAQSKQGQCASF